MERYFFSGFSIIPMHMARALSFFIISVHMVFIASGFFIISSHIILTMAGSFAICAHIWRIISLSFIMLCMSIFMPLPGDGSAARSEDVAVVKAMAVMVISFGVFMFFFRLWLRVMSCLTEARRDRCVSAFLRGDSSR